MAPRRDGPGNTSEKRSWIKQFSAGGVVVRRENERLEYLAIKPAHRDRWQLPKGTIDRGETAEQAAMREVREEGGVEASILGDLGSISYFYRMGGRGYAKTVHFYLMKYEAGDPAAHDKEVQEAVWLPLDESNRLAFESERSLLEKSREMIQAIGGNVIRGPSSRR